MKHFSSWASVHVLFSYFTMAMAAITPPAPTPSPTPVTTLPLSTSNIVASSTLPVFASAASVESILRNQAALKPLSAGILIPSGIPHYNELTALARLWPPIPTYAGMPPGPSPFPYEDFASYQEEAIAKSDNSSSGGGKMGKRDGTHRILIVGGIKMNSQASRNVITNLFNVDSMTHGQEGDFTWRYRIWRWLVSTSDARILMSKTRPRHDEKR